MAIAHSLIALLTLVPTFGEMHEREARIFNDLTIADLVPRSGPCAVGRAEQVAHPHVYPVYALWPVYICWLPVGHPDLVPVSFRASRRCIYRRLGRNGCNVRRYSDLPDRSPCGWV